ncbi:MAG: D-alanyl-D-alanine carboxypeptidase [Oscillospiraceae bacterium]|jgi:D-alanyl-D-alanine carboxypeptidase/D-alanyl-D-alanine carboxypeptidase (penicillin-binding protein 5/6)|nr:D-alanyl-D-alanine carboxypeptidase [Oscillospiraceae bacterium]
MIEKPAVYFLLLLLIFPALSPPVSAELKEVGAKAAILMTENGEIVFEQNINERLAIASTTKIMTALLVLESGRDPDEEFIVDPDAIKVEGTSMGLREGDAVSLRALCWGILLESGNDAANAAAVRVAGSVPGFAALMNEKAAGLGLGNTHFENPSGLDSEGHYSSALDMARLANYALKNEAFLEICSSRTGRASFGSPPYDRSMNNHNRLLKELDGCIGVKTGYTQKAGRCLVSAAERDGMRLLCVTLSCPDDWDIHKSLYRYGFERIEAVPLVPDLSGRRLPVAGGEANSVGLYTENTGEKLVLLKKSVPQLKQKIYLPSFVYAPVEKGAALGALRYELKGEALAETPILAAENVAYRQKTGLWDRIKSWFA